MRALLRPPSSRRFPSRSCLSRSYASQPKVERLKSGLFASVSPSNARDDAPRSSPEEDGDVMDLVALAEHLEEGYDVLTPEDVPGPPLSQPLREVPQHIQAPPYAKDPDNGKWYPRFWQDGFKIELGSAMETRARNAGALAKATLARAGELVQPGRTTDSIDSLLHTFITSRHAYPSPLNYRRFPKSCCTSINNVIVHGIPDARPLLSGDIVNIDITVFLDGYHGDTSRTFACGEVDSRGKDLIQISQDALEAGLAVCAPGRPFREVGAAIEAYVRRYAPGKSISPQFTGHGIGEWFHTPPWVLHHRNEEPGVMQPGHCFTIEPCIVDDEDWRGFLWPDGWTVSTVTGARSAQAEHTVLITQTGADVLTR